MKVKTSHVILEYILEKNRVTPKELLKKVKIGNRALYKQLGSLVAKKKISKYGIPPKVFYTPYSVEPVSNLLTSIRNVPFKVSKEDQIKELTKRVPPVVNINIVIYKDGKYLFGTRSKKKDKIDYGLLLFPGGRMRFDESVQECSLRILNTEVPGVKAIFRRLITAHTDKGTDPRSYNLNLYYLMEYLSGKPEANFQLDKFEWLSREQILENKKINSEMQGLVDEIDAAVRLMQVNAEEILVEVDEQDREVGTITKREAHNTGTRGHRAAHIVIFNTLGQVVLHQRSFNKITSPGKWDMFGGHQVAGHTIEQTAYAELSEELGINVPLKFVRKGLYKRSTQMEWYYLYYGISDGPYGFDRNEVAQIANFDCDNLLAGEYKENYDILTHVYGYVEELRFVWEKLIKVKTKEK